MSVSWSIYLLEIFARVFELMHKNLLAFIILGLVKKIGNWGYILAPWVKLLLLSLASHITVEVRVPAALFPIEHPTYVSGKGADNGSDAWVSATPVGDAGEFLASVFSLAQTWLFNWHTEFEARNGRSLFLPRSLSLALTQSVTPPFK